VTGSATERFPLSGAQAGVWMAQQLDPASRALFLSQSIELPGPVDAASFGAAVRQAFAECDALRLRILVGADGFQQEVGAAGVPGLPLVDVSDAGDPERAASAWMRTDLTRAADLTGHDLFSSALLKLAPGRFTWYQRCHHVLVDGYSSWLLAQRVAAIYTATVRNEPCPRASFGALRALIEEEAAYRGSDAFERDKAYWNHRFRDRPPVTGLTETLASPADECLRTTCTLPPEAIGRLAAATGLSDQGWPAIVIAAVAAYLHRVTGTQDVILGMPVTGRRTPASLRTPGMLANILPLRLDVHAGMSMAELIPAAARETGRLLRHQRYSGEMLRRDLGLLDSGGLLYGPEVNILSVDQALDFAGIPATLSNVSNGPVADTSICAYRDPRDHQLKIDYTANPRCYGEAEAAGHAARFTHFFRELAAHAAGPIGDIGAGLIGDIAVMRPDELRQVRLDGSGTQGPDGSGAARDDGSGAQGQDGEAGPAGPGIPPGRRPGGADGAAPPAVGAVPVAAGGAHLGDGEAIIRRVFADLLGLPDVGAADSFFALGGDSVLAVAAVTRAAEAGLAITPRDVFQLKTAQALARAAAALPGTPGMPGTPDGSPDDGAGFVPATPVMHWLREIGGPVDGFHQGMLVNVPADLTLPSLRIAVQALLDRHDLLRAQLMRSVGGAVWGLHVRETGAVRAESCVRRVDVTGQSAAGQRRALAAEFAAARDRLAPGEGEMTQIIWFDHGRQRPGRLLLVVHHLVIDGVSWRILLPDLRDAWQCAASGRDVALRPAGTSFRRWSESLLIASQHPRWASTLPTWTRMLQGPAPRLGRRPRDRAADVAGRTRRIGLDLDAPAAGALLTRVPSAFGASVRDVLVASLALAIAEPGGDHSVLIDLEGHGREEVAGHADTTRTVGWFTSIFPLRIDLREAGAGRAPVTGEGAVALVKQVKEQLRDLPGAGVGYGMLRYLNPVTAPVLAGLPSPEVCFNYLGRFSVPDDDGEPWLPRADSGTLASPAPDQRVGHLLEIVAAALDGPDGARLSITLTWPQDAVDASVAEGIADRWAAALRALAAHIAATGATGLTPSDVPLVTLSQDEIDEFEGMYQAGSASDRRG